jgi:hypothetical protein
VLKRTKGCKASLCAKKKTSTKDKEKERKLKISAAALPILVKLAYVASTKRRFFKVFCLSFVVERHRNAVNTTPLALVSDHSFAPHTRTTYSFFSCALSFFALQLCVYVCMFDVSSEFLS